MSNNQPTTEDLVNQILAQAPSPEVALAMLFGSQSESGQNPTKNAGGGYGAFQFTPPSAWTDPNTGLPLTSSEADNPADAVATILPSYESAAQVAPSYLTGAPLAEWIALNAELPSNYQAESGQIANTSQTTTYGAATKENPQANYAKAVDEYNAYQNLQQASASGDNAAVAAALTAYTQALGSTPSTSTTNPQTGTPLPAKNPAGKVFLAIDNLLNGHEKGISTGGLIPFTSIGSVNLAPLLGYAARGLLALFAAGLVYEGIHTLVQSSPLASQVTSDAGRAGRTVRTVGTTAAGAMIGPEGAAAGAAASKASSNVARRNVARHNEAIKPFAEVGA